MSRKRLVTMLGAACVSLLLAACVPGLFDDGSQYFGRGDEGESNSERQTMEAFIDETVPRYMSIVEDVAVEAGGTLGVGAKPDISGCGPTSNGFEIRLARYYIPLMDYEDLSRVVADGAQRYGFSYSTDPVPRDKLKMRSVDVGDQDGNTLSFHHLEDDTITVFFDSGCLPAAQPEGLLKRLRFPEPEELFSRVTIVDAFDANKQRNPLIFRQVTTGSDKKSGS